MLLDNYNLRILDLAQRWLLDLLAGAEKLELAIGFRAALEDESLGAMAEMSVDKLEWRLHQLFDDQPERPALRSCYLHNSLQLCRTPVF